MAATARLAAFRGRQFFRHAHFGAARARIPLYLLRAGPDDFLRKHPETSFPGEPLKRLFHPAVFQRVITEITSVLRNLKWQGPAKETARVPPLLDSPLSAAPETFLSRDAVSAFPLLFEPLPQPLPDVRCRGWAAPSRLPWRFCVNPSPPPSDRGDRPVPSPASGSQFLPP